jgi:tetratricopeptide (TPR) repeat protein
MRRKSADSDPHGTAFRDVAVAGALLILSLVAATLAYAPGLSSPFLFDDERYVHHNDTLRRVWPPGWIHAGTQETRPLTNLSFALDNAAFGAGPRGHHVVNLALHLLSIVLLFALVWRMRRAAGAGAIHHAPLLPGSLAGPRGAPLLAAGAAIILALHPAHSASVLYIQGRPGLLATGFGLAAMLAALDAIRRWERSRHRVPRTVAVTLLVVLATLSKESGAVVPALVLLYDAALASPGDARGLRERLLRFHLPLWGGLLPLALAFATLHNPHAGVFGAGVVDVARFFATQPLVLLFYLRLYLWPAGLAVDRTFAMLSPTEPAAWLGWILVIALATLLIRSLRRSPWAGFWGLWWLAALAPTSLIPNREFAAERYLAFATPAVAALGAWAMIEFATWAAARARLNPRASFTTLAVCLALPLGGATFGRAQIWRSDLALWREATRVSPDNSRAWYQYARLLFGEDSLESAEGAARRALALGVPSHLPLLLLSDIEATKGELDSSIDLAGRAVLQAPGRGDAHLGLARALAREERWPEMEREAARALQLDPATKAALYLRGRARAESGDLDGARADAASLTRLGAGEVEAAALSGMIAARAGRLGEAAMWLDRATKETPADQDESLAYIDALRARAPALLALGRADDAIHCWQIYFTVTGAERWDAASLLGIARAFRVQGRDREAQSALQQVAALRTRAVKARESLDAGK